MDSALAGAPPRNAGAGATPSAPAAATEPVAISFSRRRLVIGALALTLGGLAFTTRPPGADAAVGAILAAVVVVVAAVDLERRIIPNRIVLPAIAVVLAVRLASAPDRVDHSVAAALGAGLFFLIPNLINRSLIGMGDVKLAVLLGAGLGGAVVAALMVAFLSVFPVALLSLIRHGAAGRGRTLPFGPFLALGALVVLLLPPLLGA